MVERMRRGLASVLAVLAAAAFTATARAEVARRQPGRGLARARPGHGFIRGADGTLQVSELPAARSRRGSRSAATWTRVPARPAAPPRTPTCSSAAATARSTRSRSSPSERLDRLVPARAPDAVRADRLGPQGQRDPRPVLARRRQRHRGQVVGPGLGLDRRQHHPARPRADASAPAVGLAQQRPGRRDRARHRRPRVPQRLQRLGLERLGADPRRHDDPARARRDRAHARTRSTSSCAPAPARCAGSPGTAPPGRAGRPCPAASTPGPPSSPTTASRMWLFARRGGDVVYNVYENGTGPENGWSGWRLLHPPPPAAPAAARLRPRRRPADGPRQARALRQARRGWRAARAGPTARRSCPPTITASPARGGWTRTATAGRERLLLDAAARPARRGGSTSRRWRPARARSRARARACAPAPA